MLRSGQDYLAALRDGRRIFLGGELVTDVTTHSAFRNTARSFARIYDRKRDCRTVEIMSFAQNGERFTSWFLLPRQRAELEKRAECHRRVAEWSVRAARPIRRSCARLHRRHGHGAGPVRGQSGGFRQERRRLFRASSSATTCLPVIWCSPRSSRASAPTTTRRSRQSGAAHRRGGRPGHRGERIEAARHVGGVFR